MYAQSSPTLRLSNIGRKLVENGLMSEDQAIEALAKAAEKGRTFTSHLVREKLIDAVGFAARRGGRLRPAADRPGRR